MSFAPPALRLAFALPDLLRLPAAAPSAPALARLLAAAGAPALERDGLDAALAALHGIARQSDWPLAPIRAAARGLDASRGYWLAADPVTLVAGRDDVRLANAVTDLGEDESAALLATLAAHFAQDGLTFVAPRPDAWFARVTSAPEIRTTPLAVALGRTLRALLPAGRDAGTWRRWQNEIQMLLHEHPVNAARERRGAPVANSVWFAEGGTLPPRGGTPIRTCADGGIATALAQHAGAPAVPLPAGLEAAMAATDMEGMAEARPTLLVAFPACPDLAALDRNWLAPAWRALARGRVDAVSLLGSGDGGAATWRASRPGRWARLASRFDSPAAMPLLAAARAQLADDD